MPDSSATPAPRPPRENIALRVGPGAVSAIDAIAAEREWTRSHAARHLLERGLRDYQEEQRQASRARGR